MLAPILIAVSALLFVSSLTAFGMLQFPETWETVPFQWWLHPAVLIVLGLGFWELHRLRKAGADHALGFFGTFPLWLIPLGLLTVVLVAPIWSPSRFNLGTTPEGERIHRKSTFENQGKYYLRINNKYTREISRAEYLAFEREGREFFVRIWILASYLALVFWEYLWRRRRALDQPVIAADAPHEARR